jgi:hypothetical protein
MRMSCGWSDGRSTNQALAIPPPRASTGYSLCQSNYYNRLEYLRSVRRMYASACSDLRWLAAMPQPFGRLVVGAAMRRIEAQAFLSLVHVRQSCQQPFGGVTPLGRDIA